MRIITSTYFLKLVVRLPLMFLIAFSGELGISQVNSTIQVNAPRPLAAWADQLQATTGIPINYEDARYLSQSDLVDVTSSVVRDIAEHPNLRVLAPRGGILTTNAALSVPNSSNDLLPLVSSAISAHSAAGFPGEFAARELGGTVFIEPSRVRDVTGSWATATSILNSSISFPTLKRTAYETLGLILSKVSAASSFSVVLGTVPLNQLLSTTVTLGSDGGTARDAVLALFKALHKSMSYRLFYDATLKMYAFNLESTTKALVPHGTTTPAPGQSGGKTQSANPWFDKTATGK